MKFWLTGLLVVLLGAAGWYFFKNYQQQAEQAPPPPALPEVVHEPAAEEVPYKAPEPAMREMELEPEPFIEELPLPTLAESDPLAIETFGGLVGEPMVARYFAREDVISRMVATIDALSGRQIPGAIAVVQGPEGEFEVTADDQPDAVILNEEGDPIPQFIVDPVNYRRYLVYVEMIEAVDAEQLADLYSSHYSLFQEAYRQLGYPDQDFNGRLLALIDELLASPDVQDPVRLMKPEAYYLFADKELEALPAGQKTMVRMGSANAARVKSKLAEIREALRRTPPDPG